MSSTRRSCQESPLSYERYLSSPVFASLRPIPGNIVLAKAMLYPELKQRELVLFLQSMSMQNGGLRSVAEQIIAWFPERCRSDESQEGCRRRLSATLEVREPGRQLSMEQLTCEGLSDFLIELAINPQINLREIECPCFDKLGDALAEYKKVYEQRALRDFVVTTSGTAIQETLNQALKLSRMVVIEGSAGVGKSTNAKAWCDARPGRARYITLSGITNRTVFFQNVGQSIGLATCQRKAQELQAKIEDFFARSRMMLVIDEAHFLWPQTLRVASAPELIDWIDTALVNKGVPVALVCTDQFSKLKNRVERNTGWTSDQFIRRVFRFRKLDEMPTRADVEAVTRKLLCSVWNEGQGQWGEGSGVCDISAVEALVHYAMSRPTPFSCIISCVDEARSLALDAGRVLVTKHDLRVALGKGQIPSDAALAASFLPAPAERRGRKTQSDYAAATKPNKAFVSAPAIPLDDIPAPLVAVERQKQISKTRASMPLPDRKEVLAK